MLHSFSQQIVFCQNVAEHSCRQLDNFSVGLKTAEVKLGVEHECDGG